MLKINFPIVCFTISVLFATSLHLYPTILCSFSLISQPYLKSNLELTPEIFIYLVTVTTIIMVALSSLAFAHNFRWHWLDDNYYATTQIVCKSGCNNEDSSLPNQVTSSALNPNEDHLRHILLKPRLTFHYFFLDLWKLQQKNLNKKRSLTLTALEASRKWNRMCRLERFKYKELLERRLHWQGLRENPYRISMTQLINSQ